MPGPDSQPSRGAQRRQTSQDDPLLKAFRHASRSRTEDARPPLARREKILIFWIALLLVTSPWMLGSTRGWAQLVQLGLATAAFLFLFLPVGRNFDEKATAGANLRRLVRLPFFWLGLPFLAYVLIQCLNPDAAITLYAPVRHIIDIEPLVSWLPRGFRATFEPYNGYRVLVLQTTAFLTVCTVCVGLLRRRSIILLCWIALWNGVAVAAFAIWQKVLGFQDIAGVIKNTVDAKLFGPFWYCNHAGMFLYLTLAITLGLAFHYWMDSRKTFAGSGPHIFLLLPALLFACAAVYSSSLGGAAVAASLIACALVIAGISMIAHGLEASRIVPAIFMCLLLLAAIVYPVFKMTDFTELEKKYSRADIEAFGQQSNRTALREVAWKLAQRDLVWGSGAGCFPYYSDFEIIKYPFFQDPHRTWKLRYTAVHAHCEPLEFLVEFGIVGCALWVIAVGAVVCTILRRLRHLPGLSLAAVLGLIALVGHSWFDFALRSGAILVLAAFLLAAAARLSQLDQTHAVWD